jgi:hypothetical protein
MLHMIELLSTNNLHLRPVMTELLLLRLIMIELFLL